jgi:hypothetical protein
LAYELGVLIEITEYNADMSVSGRKEEERASGSGQEEGADESRKE